MKANLDHISDRQLQAMHGNLRAWDRKLRAAIQVEWGIRGLTAPLPIEDEFHKEIQSNLTKPLPWKWRISIALLPFPSPVHPIIAAQLMDRGYSQQFKDFYLYRALGFGLWYCAILFLGKAIPALLVCMRFFLGPFY